MDQLCKQVEYLSVECNMSPEHPFGSDIEMSNSRSVAAMIEFHHIHMSYTETLAEFLARYHRVWMDIHESNISGVIGIVRLVPLLPEDWQEWAASIAARYVTPQFWDGVLFGDCRAFIAAISTQYMCFSYPPPGPYQPLIPVGEFGLQHLMPQDYPILDQNPPENPEPIASPIHGNNGFDTNSFLVEPLANGYVSSPSQIETQTFVPEPSVLPNGVASASFVEEVPNDPSVETLQALNSSELDAIVEAQPILFDPNVASTSGPRHYDSDEDNVDPEVGPTEGYFHLRRIPFTHLSFQPSFRPSPGEDITYAPRVTLDGVERAEESTETEEEDPNEEDPRDDEEEEEEEDPSEDEQ